MLDSLSKRNSLMKFLANKGIMSKVFFYPVHKTKFYSNVKSQNLENTNNISNKILSLPMYPDLTKEEMNYIVNSISEFAEKKNL